MVRCICDEEVEAIVCKCCERMGFYSKGHGWTHKCKAYKDYNT